MTDEGVTYHRGGVVVRGERMVEVAGLGKKAVNKSSDRVPGQYRLKPPFTGQYRSIPVNTGQYRSILVNTG